MNLKFKSGDEFQNFFSQLASAELGDFQSVEGSGGDGGFDGIYGPTAYQAYFPEPKNRTRGKFIQKIDIDLPKVIETSKRLDLNIDSWILVVPVDLGIDVIAYLSKKSKETKIKCSYWGASKLSQLVTKYPYIQDSFPDIFLPPVREILREIDLNLKHQGEDTKISELVPIIRDSDFYQQKKNIWDEYQKKIKDFPKNRHGRVTYGYEEKDLEFSREAKKAERELESKKKASDKAYELELDELNEIYDENVEKLKEEMAKKGLFSSGIKGNAIGKIEIKRKRQIERLKLKYGKEDLKLEVADLHNFSWYD